MPLLLDDLDRLRGVRVEEKLCHIHVAQRCREGRPSRTAADESLKPAQDTLKMGTAFLAYERVQFVDDNEIKLAKKFLDLVRVSHEPCFQGFRRDDQDAPGFIEHPILLRAA